MSYCQEKNRLIAAHAEAVNDYFDGDAKHHDWNDLLTSCEPSSVQPNVEAALLALAAHRAALDTHISTHGCSTIKSPPPRD
jgi:hypothetical protein